MILSIQSSSTSTFAQSIGYHPNLFLGFNPYLSPVHGYGLGFPYGTHGFGASKQPWLTGPVLGPQPLGIENQLLGKVHAKSFLKKFATHPFGLSSGYGGLKNKIMLLKHPEYSYTPHGLDYGYGKHYGSAMIHNNPYKSAYGDYYHQSSSIGRPAVSSQFSQVHNDPNRVIAQSPINTNSILKPLIKVGALLTTAAILGKKTFESPLRLNPSGMIMNGRNIV